MSGADGETSPNVEEVYNESILWQCFHFYRAVYWFFFLS